MTTSTKTTTASLIGTTPKAGTNEGQGKEQGLARRIRLTFDEGAPEAGSSKNNTSADHVRTWICVTFITSIERN
tara:strand:+ start:720 stop:941 length:222 start_codon:yes stop_codon:yes gene_type:complete